MKEIIKRKDNGQMVVKDALQDVMREIDIMKELDHVCIIKLFEVIDDQNDKLYMGNIIKFLTFSIVVMDYAHHG